MESTLLEHIRTIEISGILAAFFSLIAWWQGFYRLPLELPTSHVRPYQCFSAFVLFLAVELIAAPILATLWASWEAGQFVDVEAVFQDPVLRSWLNCGAITLLAVVFLIFLVMQKRETLEAIFGVNGLPVRTRTIGDFTLGAVTWWIAYPLVIFIGQWVALIVAVEYQGPHAEQVAVRTLRTAAESPELFWMMIILVVTVVPFIEEVLFRGYMQSWLKSLVGRKAAIVLTALVFAFFHFSSSQGVDNIELITSLAILALFLGFLRERQQSLWASIGLHSAFNGISTWMIFHL